MKARQRRAPDGARRFGVQDMPMLRAMREAYGALLAKVPEVIAGETDPAMLLAAAKVRADLEADYARCGAVLSQLERTPNGWLP